MEMKFCLRKGMGYFLTSQVCVGCSMQLAIDVSILEQKSRPHVLELNIILAHVRIVGGKAPKLSNARKQWVINLCIIVWKDYHDEKRSNLKEN
jgi:hypothetical protein